ncbi:hypothetical protein B0H66DRAFT_84804 [Apodospora peruviana]|uniref:Uncharacterized protein n=1 Tax=Apodospora peruviana TaxID=516989 RepID=A0AAE0IU38_9PEZI|nr:hypothetical protein B0H66DRAFT_84804 [Apodospora peruviana]
MTLCPFSLVMKGIYTGASTFSLSLSLSLCVCVCVCCLRCCLRRCRENKTTRSYSISHCSWLLPRSRSLLNRSGPFPLVFPKFWPCLNPWSIGG